MKRRVSTRHFTMTDDWALLHPKMDNNAWRVYCILKTKIRHANGGFPEHGFRITVTWLRDVTKHLPGMSESTLKRALVVLTDKVGALRRASAKVHGEPVWYEFVVDPGADYSGPMSMSDHEAALRKKGELSPRAMFREEDLTGNLHASGGRYRKDEKSSGSGKKGKKKPRSMEQEQQASDPDLVDELAELAAEMRETEPQAVEPEPVGKKDVVPAAGRSASAEQQELARLLVRKCHNKGLNQRGILEGEALRVAAVCDEALRQGWSAEGIANKLSALVSDKIHSIEPFLRSRAGDLGTPPAVQQGSGVTEIDGQYVDLGSINTWGPAANKPQTGQRQAEPALTAPASDEDSTKKARLAKLARQTRRY